MMCQKGPATWPFAAGIGIDRRFPSVLSAECVEVDDFYIEVRSKGIRECGTKQQPMLTAMDRAPVSCAAWIPGNSSNTTTSVICPRSVPMPGVGYRQGRIASASSSRKSTTAQTMTPRFPRARISNIKAYVEGAFHGLPKAHIQVVYRLVQLVQLKIQPQGFF